MSRSPGAASRQASPGRGRHGGRRSIRPAQSRRAEMGRVAIAGFANGSRHTTATHPRARPARPQRIRGTLRGPAQVSECESGAAHPCPRRLVRRARAGTRRDGGSSRRARPRGGRRGRCQSWRLRTRAGGPRRAHSRTPSPPGGGRRSTTRWADRHRCSRGLDRPIVGATPQSGTRMSRRELIDTRTGQALRPPGERGRFRESDDVGRSLAADRRRRAATDAEVGQGDRGDRREGGDPTSRWTGARSDAPPAAGRPAGDRRPLARASSTHRIAQTQGPRIADATFTPAGKRTREEPCSEASHDRFPPVALASGSTDSSRSTG